jgi:hypothetical protein
MQTLNIVDFIVFSLAIYRATRLVTQDEVFSNVRNKIWNRYPPETTRIGYLFTCEWCSSVWLGLGFATWYTIDATTFRFFAVALALSAMAGLLTAYENKE